MDINYEQASFKDFEDIPGMDFYGWADQFDRYVKNWESRGHWNYRQGGLNGCQPEVELAGHPGKRFVALVFNDYLGLTQHPKVKAAAVAAIEQFGVGAAASPAIGAHFSYHRQLEEKIARFFRRESAVLFTTGYTANSATIQSLLKMRDLAI